MKSGIKNILTLSLLIFSMQNAEAGPTRKAAPQLVSPGGLGAIIVPQSQPMPMSLPNMMAAPVAVDWRQTGVVTSIKNQGGCGSCVPFAAVATLESQVMMQNSMSLDLSEQIILSCSSLVNCSSGSRIDQVTSFLGSTGVPLETELPNIYTVGPCSAATPGWQTRTLKPIFFLPVNKSVSSLESVVANFGPVITAFDVYEDFYYSYAGGIYKHLSGNRVGGHAVVIVGYDRNAQYFIAKNSWGSNWGEGGFFRIHYSQVDNEVGFGSNTYFYVGSTGNPFQHRLRIRATDENYQAIPQATISNGSKTLTADSAGWVDFGIIPDGTYNVTASKNGFIANSASVTLNSDLDFKIRLKISGGGGGDPDYVGCFTDGSPRALPTSLGNNHTIASCKDAAKAQNLNYAGLQYGGECWAGNNLGFNQVSDSECNMACGADPGRWCGAVFRNSIYKSGGGGGSSGGTTGGTTGGTSGNTTGGNAMGSTNLYANQQLLPGQSITSPNGHCQLVYQQDGNLVMYPQQGIVWSSNTQGTTPQTAYMQGDGNFVIYEAGTHPIWATNTFTGGSFLALQDDCNIVIYPPGSTPDANHTNALWWAF